jgi:hypothetical protein
LKRLVRPFLVENNGVKLLYPEPVAERNPLWRNPGQIYEGRVL